MEFNSKSVVFYFLFLFLFLNMGWDNKQNAAFFYQHEKSIQKHLSH